MTELQDIVDRLDMVAQVADARRFDGGKRLSDPDIADPLGLGLEAYRATAWELGHLVDRLVDTIFPGGQAPPAEAAPAAGADHTTGEHR